MNTETEYTLLSQWSLEGYYSDTSQMKKKLSEINKICQSLNLGEPQIEDDVHSYGVTYKIWGSEAVLEHISPIWRDDFEI